MTNEQRIDYETVLVVDDEPEICSQLNIFLSHEGFKVLTALNGEEGLHLYRMHRPAVVVTDFKMPGMNGLELLGEIKQISDVTQIIFLSGHADMKVALRALKEHAFDFLQKPADLDELRSKVQDALQQCRRLATPTAYSSSSILNHQYIDQQRPVSVLHVHVDLDEVTRNKIRAAFERYFLNGDLARRVVISLNHVSRINNVGLNLLLDIERELKEANRSCVLAQVNQSVMSYLKVLGYNDYFRIHQSLDDAIALA